MARNRSRKAEAALLWRGGRLGLALAIVGVAGLVAGGCGRAFSGGSGGDAGAGASGAGGTGASGTGASAAGGAGGTGGSGGAGTTTVTSDGGGGAAGLPLGAPCDQPSACASGSCVDGVCCDSACTAKCAACTFTKNGGNAPDGQCAPIASGHDPDEECAEYCAEDAVMVGSCNGTTGCQWNDKIDCFPYTCDPNTQACFQQCVANVQCAQGAYCKMAGNICISSA